MIESAFFNKMVNKLFTGSEVAEFQSCFINPPPRSYSVIHLKRPFGERGETLWLENTRELDALKELQNSGEVYVVDKSSTHLLGALQLLPKLELILDACAAPGGKALLAWKALRPDLLICNEVTQSRIKTLISNLNNCGVRPCEVFHLSTKVIGDRFEKCFPLVLADVPCSSQSLILKGERVSGAFHPQNINGNAMRQRRILSDLSCAVSPGGHLIYSTCTFSIDENEAVLEWFLKRNARYKAKIIPTMAALQSHLSPIPCYRIWPHRQEGAGGFFAILCNEDEGEKFELPDYTPIWKKY